MKRSLADMEQELCDCASKVTVLKCAEAWSHIMNRDGWTQDYRDAARDKVKARIAAVGSEADDIPTSGHGTLT